MLIQKSIRIKQGVYLTALALLVMFVTGCASGVKTNLDVSDEFLIGLDSEIDVIYSCCPYTMEVIKDWIAQNEP